MKCKFCNIELKEKSKTENNDVYGPGYREWYRYIYKFWYCPKCGLLYYFERSENEMS